MASKCTSILQTYADEVLDKEKAGAALTAAEQTQFELALVRAREGIISIEGVEKLEGHTHNYNKRQVTDL